MKSTESLTAHIHYCSEGTCTRGVMYAGQRCGEHENKSQQEQRRHTDYQAGSQTMKTISGNGVQNPVKDNVKQSLAVIYPKYYKQIPEGIDALDTYALNQMFPVDDPTGCILHARKKLLVPGTRTGGKSFREDIKEARDTLTRYLELTDDGNKPKGRIV